VARFRRLVRAGLPAPRRLRRLVLLLARKFGVAAPAIRVVPGLATPGLWALGRPLLLWPAALAGRWDVGRCRAAAAHELAHLRRRDHWVRWLLLVAGIAWWWCPLWWYVRRQLAASAEWACDAWVVWALPEDRRAYVEALIDVSALAVAAAPVPALGIGGGRHALQRRLIMILSDRLVCRAPAWGLAGLALLALAALPGWSAGQAQEGPQIAELKQQILRLEQRLREAQQEAEHSRAEALAQADAARAAEAHARQRAEAEARAREEAFRQRDAATAAERAARDAAEAHGLRKTESRPATGALIGGLVGAATGKAGSEGGPGALGGGAWASTRKVAKGRPWGPEQATGAPDTPDAGDRATAWASRTPDGQDEWLELTYATPVHPQGVLIVESFNPGAVYQVELFTPEGQVAALWTGKDPTAPGSGRGLSFIPVQSARKVNRVKIYLASREVPGWNEIDAVGLLDVEGKLHWAAEAKASSTYADEAAAPGIGGPPALEKIPYVNRLYRTTGPETGTPKAAPMVPVQPPQRLAPAPAPPPKTAAPDADQRLDRLERDMHEVKALLHQLRGLLDKGPPVKP
jgi:hypothetical protein